MAKETKKQLTNSSVEVCLPASSSNLGAGFDCFGVALKLYLTIRATASSKVKDCKVTTTGPRENAALPKGPNQSYLPRNVVRRC
jgi:homoserine kinase